MLAALRFILLAATAASVFGCGSIVPTDAQHLEVANRNVTQRVAFDLGCNDPRLFRLGDVAHLGTYMTRTTIGAACADKKATYVVTCVSNWGNITCTPELNSAPK